MNYKCLPMGGTDLWSHYPTANPFTNDLRMQPAAEGQAPASHQELPVTDDGQDIMIGSPRAAEALDVENAAAQHPAEGAPTSDGRARYEAAVAALEQHTYASPFADTMMAPPVH